MYTISPVHACFALRDIRLRGLPEEPLFTGTALSSEQLESGRDINVEDFLRLLENARTYTGDETLGLIIGRHANVAAFGPVGGALATAPTLREGLQVLENFSRLHATYVRVTLSSQLGCLSIRFRYLLPLGEVGRFHVETAIMFIQSYVEMLTDRPLHDALYCLPFENPGYDEAYAQSMHSPVSFGHETTRVDLPHHWLDLRSPYFNAEMWNQAQFHLAQRMKEISTDSDNTYTQHIRAQLRSFEPPLPDLDTIVGKMHLSPRTLNRRLQQEGSNFRSIRADVMQHWARQYLSETEHTVEAIAAILGYQDTANFRRAFRQREGCSPNQFRQSHANTKV